MSGAPLVGLRTGWMGRPLRLYERCDSTNERLLDWAADGAEAGASCLALEQTRGRGRQGRVWASGVGQGLYASVLLRPAPDAPPPAAFALVVGLCVARALEEAAGVGVRLKWPNDLLREDRKLGGILLESRGGDAVVVGLGLNLRPPARGWEGELAGRATSLLEQGVEAPAPGPLWAACLNHLEPAWERYAAAGLEPFLPAWSERDALRGRRVTVEHEGSAFAAVAEGVEADGRLRVRREDGAVQRLLAGEVHLGEGGRR